MFATNDIVGGSASAFVEVPVGNGAGTFFFRFGCTHSGFSRHILTGQKIFIVRFGFVLYNSHAAIK